MSKGKWGSIGSVVRGGLWLYASSIINNVAGFIYWVIISRIGGATVLGITSTTVGIASIISAALSLGITTGSQRFLGKCMGTSDKNCLRKYFYTSLIYTLVTYSSAGSILILAGKLGVRIGNIDPEMFKIAGILVVLNSFAMFSSLLVSCLKTSMLTLASFIGNTFKIALGVYLVAHGWGWVGAALGYISSSITRVVITSTYGFKLVGYKPTFSLLTLKEVITAGIVSWLPGLVIILGNWLGVLAVFTTVSAAETGQYYITLAIANVVIMISWSMTSLLLPVLSGMKSGRNKAAARVLRLSASIVTPIASAIATYPWLPLSILGKMYIGSIGSLIILLLSSLPITITSSVSSLTYALGMYDRILILGLIQNTPRLILYYILTPRLGSIGAATSFTIGSFTGLSYALILARWLKFNIGLRSIALVAVVPSVLGVVLWFARAPWFVGLPVIACSYLAYVRLGVLSRADVRDVAYAFLSEGFVRKVYSRLRPLLDHLLPPA